MKKNVIFVVLLICFLGSMSVAFAQITPSLSFVDEPRTHNVHMAGDGEFLYTVNGGKAHMGRINKYSASGELMATYNINLDMRSLMFDEKSRRFYVCTYDRNIYLITDMERGRYELVLSELYDNPQANLAISANGKFIYCMDKGALTTYKFPGGKMVSKIYGFDAGKDVTTGASCVAVYGKYFYTWDSAAKLIFESTKSGKKIRTIGITDGDFGWSLSVANGKIWVANDGDYATGKWFGYNIWP